MRLKLLMLPFLIASPALAWDDSKPKLEVSLSGLGSDGAIPEAFAYCAPDGKGRTKDGGNKNPTIRWSGAPKETRSFAVVVVDPDVPASFENANQDGKEIAEGFPRQDFIHWLLSDIPATRAVITEGEASDGVVKGGKKTGRKAYGVDWRNDYAKMSKGPNGGYDGPCPPWNDQRLHHYHFRVYALDTPALTLPEGADGQQFEQALSRHILAQGEAVGTFTNNPKLAGEKR